MELRHLQIRQHWKSPVFNYLCIVLVTWTWTITLSLWCRPNSNITADFRPLRLGECHETLSITHLTHVDDYNYVDEAPE